jgi:uncharacterized protein YqjF (DUF2071 family)
VTYEAKRKGLSENDRFRWKRTAAGRPAEAGPLEFFLVERYRLFAADGRGGLLTGQVHHAPYQISVPELTESSSVVGRAAGFEFPGPPPLVHAVAGVDVTIHPLKSVA